MLVAASPLYADEIVLGMSAAFSGPARSLGIELYRGSAAYLDDVNRNGGVHGRRVVVRTYDDAYEPVRAIQNTLRLVEQDGVFALFDYVGTPTVTRVLPLLKHYAGRDLLMFFPFTGAQPQRGPPYDGLVFNLRASYRDETAALVRHFLGQGRERIAVFYQADAYGRGGWEGVRQALRGAGLDVAGEATYRRGIGFEADLAEPVRILRASGADAVIAVCSYAACAAFIRDARDAGWDVPIANLSFSGSEAMAGLLAEIAESSGRSYDLDLITSQVVPSYQDVSLPAVIEYRASMARLGAHLPDGIDAGGYRPQAFSFASFEGYLNARVLVLALQALGPDLRRQDLRAAVEGLGVVDIGIGVPLEFGQERHQGLHAVFLTELVDGAFQPIGAPDIGEAPPP